MTPLKNHSNTKVIGKAKTQNPKLPKQNKNKRKNVSKKVPNGTILQTRDEYFKSAGDYRKPGYQNKGLYRKIVVIDSNANDELAVVKGTTKGIPLHIPDFISYKPFVETKDEANTPIKVGNKFVPAGKFLSPSTVNTIKKECFTNLKTKKENQRKIRNLKGR